MAITHLSAASHYRRMPWKNGRGETIEIAKFPEEAGLDGFDWRISMASVAEDGPFSSFPAIDRTLAVLTGGGMVLDIEGQGETVLSIESQPLAFPADVPTSARLVAGPITDLNLMTRRSHYAHRMTCVSLPTEHAGIPGGLVFLIVKGEASTEGQGFSSTLADTDALRLTSPDDQVRIEGSGTIYRLEIRSL